MKQILYIVGMFFVAAWIVYSGTKTVVGETLGVLSEIPDNRENLDSYKLTLTNLRDCNLNGCDPVLKNGWEKQRLDFEIHYTEILINLIDKASRKGLLKK